MLNPLWNFQCNSYLPGEKQDVLIQMVAYFCEICALQGRSLKTCWLAIWITSSSIISILEHVKLELVFLHGCFLWIEKWQEFSFISVPAKIRVNPSSQCVHEGGWVATQFILEVLSHVHLHDYKLYKHENPILKLFWKFVLKEFWAIR